jgi:hypothetical protein
MTESTSLARSRPAPSGLRLAELVGALSLAVDLGLGQPMEHLARSCLLACRLGEEMGLGEGERAALYYVALLGWVGCIADSRDAAAWFGDDLTYRAGAYDVDMKPLPFLGYLLRRAGTGGSPARRLGVGAALVATGARGVQQSLHAHCQVTAVIAERLGLGPEVCGPLQQIFARWDAKGLPAGLGGEQVALTVRPRSTTAAAGSTRPSRWPAGAAAASSTRRSWTPSSATPASSSPACPTAPAGTS